MPRRAMLMVLALTNIITIVGTIVHGRYSNRWGDSTPRRQLAATLLENLPTAFGSWQLASELPVQREVLWPILQYNAFLNREYIDQATGARVAVVVILGPPGPTSTHRPELCLTGRGFKQVGATEEFTIDGVDGARHEFARARFHSPDEAGPDLVASYAWRQKETWSAPSLARIAFGGGDYLFKLQVTTNLDDLHAEEDRSRDFIRGFIELLDKAVFTSLPGS